MKIMRDCNCWACRTCPKRTARRNAEVRRAKKRDRAAAKKGLPPVITSLTYRA
jgi:hypothetical protein